MKADYGWMDYYAAVLSTIAILYSGVRLYFDIRNSRERLDVDFFVTDKELVIKFLNRDKKNSSLVRMVLVEEIKPLSFLRKKKYNLFYTVTDLEVPANDKQRYHIQLGYLQPSKNKRVRVRIRAYSKMEHFFLSKSKIIQL